MVMWSPYVTLPLSRRMDVDLLRLQLRRDGSRDAQQAVSVLRFDGLWIDRRRKLDRTKQLAGLKLAHVHDALRLGMRVRRVRLDE